MAKTAEQISEELGIDVDEVRRIIAAPPIPDGPDEDFTLNWAARDDLRAKGAIRW